MIVILSIVNSVNKILAILEDILGVVFNDFMRFILSSLVIRVSS